MKTYQGIDFANRQTNLGRCYLTVDEESKTLTPQLVLQPDQKPAGTAVDCPFGTSEGFQKLLKGEIPQPCEWDAGYKTRATEHWLRDELWSYQTNEFWRSRTNPTPQHYVNKTGHVQSAVGLVIVPAFLHWFHAEQQQSLDNLRQGRLGQGRYVEAHPRPFLYSAIERIYRREPETHGWADILRNVVAYKDKPRESHASQRREVYDFLRQHSQSWLWGGYTLAEAPELLLATDHSFDAFLAALTVYARDCHQTISWKTAGLSHTTVLDEGHILILSQPPVPFQ